MHRILLVDDEAHVLSALRRALRREFREGQVAIEMQTSPAAALARAREASFDLVVSDFRMPGMDGVAFLAQLREIQPHAVRLMLSASTEVQTVMRALNDVEVRRFIVKPWTDDELLQQIRESLQEADRQREQRDLADAMRAQRGELSPAELERRRLAGIDPALLHVDWGPNGEVLMPDLLDPDADKPKR